MQKPLVIFMQTRSIDLSQVLVHKLQHALEAITGRSIDNLVAFFESGDFNVISSYIDPYTPQLYLSGAYPGGRVEPAAELATKLKRISPVNLTCWGLSVMKDFPAEIFPHTLEKWNIYEGGELLRTLVQFATYATRSNTEGNLHAQTFEGYFLEKMSIRNSIDRFKNEHVA
jgi:hypothetical protein